MNEHALSIDAFPSFKRSVRAHWAPVVLEPIAGSCERLVIGVAVVGKNGFHLEVANAPERLNCLFDGHAQGAILAIKIAAENLLKDLSLRALEALESPRPVISGVTIGACREAEGESLASIGVSWMLSLSSLYRKPVNSAVAILPEVDFESDMTVDVKVPLPVQIMLYVQGRKEGYGNFFRSDLREGQRRRPAGRGFETIVDFAGSRLVANFGTLQPENLSKSSGNIKQRLWDLKVDRDRAAQSTLLLRHHEMILQSPSSDDPKFTGLQHDYFREARDELKSQAQQEEMELLVLPSVNAIGDYVLWREAA